ncbi:hypothetical protein BSKO_04909 [Bryopsis sp. KO-2023]|nr:hypothetical protein BSKO_04909 [Bryopsis sp. KO-2023]
MMLKAICATIVACGLAGVCFFWRSKGDTSAKPLDAITGALVKYSPPRDTAAEEEVTDNRDVDARHQSLFCYFEEAWCRIDSWLRGGRPVATIGVTGGLTLFFVDLSSSEVYVSRSTGAAIRPSDGEGILLVMPDTVFTDTSIHDFHYFLSVAASTRLPLHAYDSAVATFFAEYGVYFPPADLRPYWLVGLPALF